MSCRLESPSRHGKNVVNDPSPLVQLVALAVADLRAVDAVPRTSKVVAASVAEAAVVAPLLRRRLSESHSTALVLGRRSGCVRVSLDCRWSRNPLVGGQPSKHKNKKHPKVPKYSYHRLLHTFSLAFPFIFRSIVGIEFCTLLSALNMTFFAVFILSPHSHMPHITMNLCNLMYFPLNATALQCSARI